MIAGPCTGLSPNIYTKEARTPSSSKRCVSCGGIFEQMMFVVFSLRERSQYQVVGWQCFDCEDKDRPQSSVVEKKR